MRERKAVLTALMAGCLAAQSTRSEVTLHLNADRFPTRTLIGLAKIRIFIVMPYVVVD
jgi:hypothetical protein